MWESRSDFQPQARAWNGCGPGGRPAGAFPVGPEGERSEFREGGIQQEIRQPFHALHRPRGGPRPWCVRDRFTYSPFRNIPDIRFSRRR